jgi:NADH:ubiquinone oxidoreductase subunit F (NADH-binding)
MTGGIVFEQTLEEATQEKNIIINAIELEPGIYQYRMVSEIETKSGILIITK